ncbi:MAG: hypothetical protein CME65_04570 [Halobacteriovoraceae bacterium]|nr:hypothetical protein [Halobacteriovoraceae bacterium]
MKVLISQKDLKDLSSGVQRKVMEEVNFLVGKGFEVHVIAETINRKMISDCNAIPVKTLKWPFVKNKRLFHAERVQKYIEKNEFDIVIGHGDIVNQDLCYIHNCVHLAHERVFGKPLSPENTVGLMHEKILRAQKFKRLVCNSEMMKEDLMRRFNIPPDKVVVIHPEFNLEKFNLLGGEKKRIEQRSKWKVQEEDVLVGLITSGNFKKRNVDLLIDVAVEIPNAKFVVAGKNKDSNFFTKVEDLNINERFLFAPSIPDVENYYHAIDIFVLPAHIEEFGRSVLEAMALSKPVIVGSYVGASELLKGKSREYILQKLTVEEFKSKLLDLIRNEDLRKKLGQENFKQAQYYSHTSQNAKFEELVSSII